MRAALGFSSGTAPAGMTAGTLRCTVLGAIMMASAMPAQAETGGFFKNMFSGGSDGSPSITAPQAYDPEDAFCPGVGVSDQGGLVQSFAGASGDMSRLRHQVTIVQTSRECNARPDGSIAVKVGVELRATLGPAGGGGRVEAPLSIALRGNGGVIAARSRRAAIPIAPGAGNGIARIVEGELIVPAAQARSYGIELRLGGAAPRERVSGRRGRPATSEAAVAGR